MKPIKVKRGDKYNRWSVIREADQKWSHRMFLCKCSCGTSKTVTLASLRSGISKSCGCLLKETNTKHGMWKSVEYQTWARMNYRCSKKSGKDWRNYGGRGIKVFPAWRKSFEKFYEHVGPRPSSAHSLDRYPDNDGGYEPGNVRWATVKEQRANTRRTVWERLLMDLCKRIGVNFEEVAALVEQRKTDKQIASHIARYWRPQA